MFEIINEIKAFLERNLQADSDFETPVVVNDAYKYNHRLQETEMQIDLLDNSEYERGSTFEGEQIAYMPLQLTVYGTQMKIGDTLRNPQDAARIVADKLCKYMGRCVHDVEKVLVCTRTSLSDAYPMNQGATRYFVAIRYDMLVVSPYKE